MLKSKYAEWIGQMFFPVQVLEGTGNIGSYYQERTNASLGLGDIVTRAVGGILEDIVRWHKARRTVAALRACSDETLRDLGMDRSEITAIVYFGGKGRRIGLNDFD